MKLAFNALLLAEESTGMRTLMVGLLNGLKDLALRDRWIVYVRPGVRKRLVLPEWAGCTYIEVGSARTLPGRVITEIVGLPYYDRKHGIDVSFSPTSYLPINQVTPAIITFVDFCCRRVPKGYSWSQRLSSGLRAEHSLLRASGVVAISETMRRDLLAAYGKRLSAPVVAMPLGVDENLFDARQTAAPSGSAPFRFASNCILTSGGTNARKDVGTLISAYARLPTTLTANVPLVVMGPCDLRAKTAMLRDVAADLRARIIFTGFVGYEDKRELFASASLFVFPTLDEGFGLPILEAMAVGVPVICSDLDVLREVGGDRAVYFPPGDVPALAREIASALLDVASMRRMRVGGRKRARMFTWRAAAEKLMTLIRQVYDAP